MYARNSVAVTSDVNKDMQGQGQGPSLQGPGQGQGLDLQGQGQGHGLTSLAATTIRLRFDALSTAYQRSLSAQRRNPLTTVTMTCLFMPCIVIDSAVVGGLDPLNMCRRGKNMSDPLKCHILSFKTVVG